MDLPILILNGLSHKTGKLTVDVSLMKEMNLAQNEFNESISLLKSKGLINLRSISGGRNLVNINDQGIAYLQEVTGRFLLSNHDLDKNNLLKIRLSGNSALAVTDFLKDYFDETQHLELKDLLEKGDSPSTRLLFKGHSNQLADCFKKLFDNRFIIGANKKSLVDWIVQNFDFFHDGKIQSFKFESVQNIISRNYNPCKNPIVTIENGIIERTHQ